MPAQAVAGPIRGPSSFIDNISSAYWQGIAADAGCVCQRAVPEEVVLLAVQWCGSSPPVLPYAMGEMSPPPAYFLQTNSIQFFRGLEVKNVHVGSAG